MKITIDTKEDSHEEIKRAIKMLSSLVGEHAVTNANIFDDDSPSLSESDDEPSQPTNAFANMFGSSEESSSVKEDESEETTETEEVSEADDDDIPPVMEY